MAKKPEVNKSKAVRDYLKAHPKAMSSEIAAALTKQGIKITPGYVANIKTKLKNRRRARRPPPQSRSWAFPQVRRPQPPKRRRSPAMSSPSNRSRPSGRWSRRLAGLIGSGKCSTRSVRSAA